MQTLFAKVLISCKNRLSSRTAQFHSIYVNFFWSCTYPALGLEFEFGPNHEEEYRHSNDEDQDGHNHLDCQD